MKNYQKRYKEACERAEKRAGRTPAQQLKLLDNKGKVAKRERARLLAVLNSTT